MGRRCAGRVLCCLAITGLVLLIACLLAGGHSEGGVGYFRHPCVASSSQLVVLMVLWVVCFV